jgi:hypothetical protein
MSDWRLIETATKDGAEVDLWVGNRREANCRWAIPSSPAHDWPRDKADWCYFHGGWGEWVELNDKPTHWMPMPEPPR